MPMLPLAAFGPSARAAARAASLPHGVPATPDNLTTFGVEVAHHFCGDRPGWKPYIHEAQLPAGNFLGQHMHKHDHLAVLVSGRARLWVDGVATEYSGYITLPPLLAGHAHAVEAVTDCIWLCVWATNVDDPAAIDAGIMEV